MTFSIVARDGDTKEWGVAVASKFLAVGAAVPYAEAGVGAIATQAFANLSYGPDGLEKLRAGIAAEDVVRELTAADDGRETRQVGVVDAQGRAAGFTGDECFDWAGNSGAENFTCQGNILVGPEVVDDMKRAFESANGELARRLLVALHAGDQAGGDRRGRQAASVLVVRKGGGYGGESDVAVDLRVDDHPTPVPELARLMDLHRLYFPRPEELDFVPIDDALARELRSLLVRAGYKVATAEGYVPGVKDALFAYVGTENLEERWSDEAKIERKVLEYLRAQPEG